MQYGEMALQFRRGKIVRPSRTNLEDCSQIGMSMPSEWLTLLIKRRDTDPSAFLKRITDWATESECDDQRYRLYGAYAYQIMKFRIDCSLWGASVYFSDYADAVHLKLSLSDMFAI